MVQYAIDLTADCKSLQKEGRFIFKIELFHKNNAYRVILGTGVMRSGWIKFKLESSHLMVRGIGVHGYPRKVKRASAH